MGSRRSGLITTASPKYISIDRKLENGCLIQKARDGKTGFVIRIKLVECSRRYGKQSKEKIVAGTAVASFQ